MRRVLYLPAALVLAFGICAIAGLGSLASRALAAGPEVTIRCTTSANCTVTGSGFTPSGRVLVQGFAGGADLSSSYVTASAPTLVCATGGVNVEQLDSGPPPTWKLRLEPTVPVPRVSSGLVRRPC
jgi:hypothetical protein